MDPHRGIAPARGQEDTSAGPGTDDRVPTALPPDPGRARDPAGSPGRGAVLADGRAEGLEGESGPCLAPPPRACRAARAGKSRPVLWSALMAWPEPLVLLLAREDSRASQGLRWSLH